MSPRSPITSFGQAINLLGRRQLQRWLQLLVYSDPNNGQHPTPLLQKAAARGRLIELLVPSLGIDPALENPGDMAFMIGTFSLLDTLLNMSMGDILHQLPLPKSPRPRSAPTPANSGATGSHRSSRQARPECGGQPANAPGHRGRSLPRRPARGDQLGRQDSPGQLISRSGRTGRGCICAPRRRSTSGHGRG
jgi:hypothetical protein